uniref:Uncharacterized protein n=1 Tax=Neogobius melanostomus TaxID=47308 RepID=A0A8C6TSE6_9GOBI
MASEREEEAQKYLQKHKIPELMDNLMSLVLFHRPGKTWTCQGLVQFESL